LGWVSTLPAATLTDPLHVEAKPSFVMARMSQSSATKSRLSSYTPGILRIKMAQSSTKKTYIIQIMLLKDVLQLCQKYGSALNFKSEWVCAQFILIIQVLGFFTFSFLICKMDISLIIFSTSQAYFVTWN
jgi:hypothetical protein